MRAVARLLSELIARGDARLCASPRPSFAEPDCGLRRRVTDVDNWRSLCHCLVTELATVALLQPNDEFPGGDK